MIRLRRILARQLISIASDELPGA